MQREVFVLYNSQPYVDCTSGLSKSYVILHSGFEASFVFFGLFVLVLVLWY